MSGVFDWLDTGISKVGDVLGKAVDTAGALGSKVIDYQTNKEATAAARALDQTPATATSPLQSANKALGGVPPVVWIVGGIAVLGVVGFMLLRKR